MTAPKRRWFRFSLAMLVALAMGAILYGSWFAFTSLVHASIGYSMEAEFQTMPVNDLEFKAWLRDQPGVVQSTVHVARPRDRTVLVVFIMSRDLRGYPTFPDLDRACKALGYGGRAGAFRDSEITSYSEERDDPDTAIDRSREVSTH
jgi:hypothetical protein